MASREDLWSVAGLLRFGPDIDAVLEDAYTRGSGGGREGFQTTSFHCSTFPYEMKACGRYALYGLLNVPIPWDEPNSHGQALMDAGKDIEQQFVKRWDKMGILLGTKGSTQAHFVDEEYWLSGYPDAILDLTYRGWPAVHIVEIKGKDHDKIEAMKNGQLGPDPYHVGQGVAYVHIARKKHAEMGFGLAGLEPARGCTILYTSRQRPRTIKTFYVPYDGAKVNEALALLLKWKHHWLSGELPQRDPSWRWTEDPCDWCEVKKLCKQDDKAKVSRLDDSALAALGKEQDASYDLEKIRADVARRWEPKAREEAA